MGELWNAIKEGWSASESPIQKAQREQREAKQAEARLMCPHCGETGYVTSKQVKQKKGISGGKATGAILTGGVSMVATGLSRKEQVTERTCANCKSVWHVG